MLRAFWEDKMYVLGGSDEHKNLLVTDMFFFDLETRTWETISAHGNPRQNLVWGTL